MLMLQKKYDAPRLEAACIKDKHGVNTGSKVGGFLRDNGLAKYKATVRKEASINRPHYSKSIPLRNTQISGVKITINKAH